MTPEALDLIERHVTDVASHVAVVAWLDDAAKAATTEQTAAFYVVLREEVADPSEVGPPSHRFLHLASVLEPHEVDALVADGIASAGAVTWCNDLQRAGAVELRAAAAELAAVPE